MDLIIKTKDYIEAFDSKNLESISNLLHENAILFDPANPDGVENRDNIMEMISGIFVEFNELSFVAKNIFCDEKSTIIEFELTLSDNKLKGVDIINWEQGKIKELRAYLY